MPPKPKTAAMIAITKKIAAHFNMLTSCPAQWPGTTGDEPMAGSVKEETYHSSISIAQIRDHPGDLAQGPLFALTRSPAPRPSCLAHSVPLRRAAPVQEQPENADGAVC